MITLAALKAHLGITVTTHDSDLTELEANVVATVERLARWYFGPADPHEYVIESATDRRNLWLPGPLIVADSDDIQVEERRYPGDVATDIDASGYQLRNPDPRDWKLVRTLGDVWKLGYEYTVICRRGYEDGEEPGEIRQLVLDVVTLKWARRDRESPDLKEETHHEVSYTYLTESEQSYIAAELMRLGWIRPAYA